MNISKMILLINELKIFKNIYVREMEKDEKNIIELMGYQNIHLYLCFIIYFFKYLLYYFK